jgi:glycerophosphoryl diester phosphodiesterase
MEEYPDIWIVTDTKDTDKENVQNEFNIMVETAKELGLESVLDRIVVQIYNEDMYSYVRQVYPFKSWIYTLYMFFGGDEETFTECVRFCYANNIGNIATWNYFVTPELIEIADEYGIAYYAHTEDDVENAKLMIEEGLSGIYTNIITPDMLEED